MSVEHSGVWNELRDVPGISGLPFPWPVGGAVRLGLHASLRRFYRLTPAPEVATHPTPPAAEPADDRRPPPAVVLVLYETSDADVVSRYERTANWFLAAGVRVPQIYGATARALIVEDGGDLLLSDHVETGGLSERYAEAAEVILKLQAHGIVEPGPNPGWRLDGERLRNELAFTEEHALRGWLGCAPSSRRDDAFERLADAVSRLPARMCHRDYHSRNLLVDGELMVVDFQDAMEGPLFYDLVSLLRDDYRDVPASARAAAIDVFWAGARTEIPISTAAEVPPGPESLPVGARQGIALTAAQRSLKALGTFGYQVGIAGREEYAAFARRAWRHASGDIAGLGWDDLLTELAAFDRL